jgi:hypothetical protein
MEGGTQRHGVDRQEPIIGQLENDHLEQVACTVWADHEHLRRVVMLVDVDNDDRVIDNMLDRSVIDAVAPR